MITKYRVWDKKSKKMRDVNSIAFHNMRGCFDGDNSNTPKVVNVWGYDCINQKDIILHREANEVDLLQFTGLSDKNGVEIYEGDIVKLTYNKTPTIEAVKYESDLGFTPIQAPCDYDEIYLNESDIEIIGNIHQHKELLK